ncbi:Ldh family oxidoreductase [Acidianus brierleyi]|uniref:Lactate dehydrogenase n=1 Tax=Acidianus brierleyi TaxID=41673 RepID=A0A2U9ICB8_9CREN|nr:Ldh family oxidoreductase [Acidianus brierleyi]AWR93647.1 Ldh family oxidoreductase [Acidianus brierleyi]
MLTDYNKLKELVTEVLNKRGIEESKVIADHFVEAELRGHSSHGVQRLIPLVKGVELGTIRKELCFEVIRETNDSILVDGMHSIGISLWNMLAEKEFGDTISIIAVRNASHVGFLGYYTEKVAKKGKVGIMIGNAEPAVVKPGSSDKILSTTPISIAIPSKIPLILDMALASTSRGKIIEASRKGYKIPYGVAVDKNGEITDEPESALNGGIMPLGGEKGFYLMLALELLVSYLSGSAVGPQVKGVLNTENPPNKGEIMIIINPRYLESKEDSLEFMRNIIKSELPGEHGLKMREIKMKRGIEIDDKLYSIIQELNNKVPYFK